MPSKSGEPTVKEELRDYGICRCEDPRDDGTGHCDSCLWPIPNLEKSA